MFYHLVVRIENNRLYFSIFLFHFLFIYLELGFNMILGLQLSQTHHIMCHTCHLSLPQSHSHDEIR